MAEHILALGMAGEIDLALELFKQTSVQQKDVEAAITEAMHAGYTLGTVTYLNGKVDLPCEVVGFNESTCGFYPGERYPIMAKQMFSGETFAYGMESLALTPSPQN